MAEVRIGARPFRVGRNALGAGRRLRVIGAVSALCFATSCLRGSEPDNGGIGVLTGSWAGRAWDGDVIAVLVQRQNIPDTLAIIAVRPRGSVAPIEDVTMKIAINGIGTYALGGTTGSPAQLHEFVGGDVIVATYSGTAGELSITGYSGPGGLVEGTFSFDATSSDLGRSYGESARFENGHFIAQVTTSTPRPIPQ